MHSSVALLVRDAMVSSIIEITHIPYLSGALLRSQQETVMPAKRSLNVEYDEVFRNLGLKKVIQIE